MDSLTPLRILDVPDPAGGPSPNQWAILCKYRPLVLADAADVALDPWSNRRSNALFMPWQEALACARHLSSSGEPVVLVRCNDESWRWLMLVTEWSQDARLID